MRDYEIAAMKFLLDDHSLETISVQLLEKVHQFQLLKAVRFFRIIYSSTYTASKSLGIENFDYVERVSIKFHRQNTTNRTLCIPIEDCLLE